LSLSTKTIDNPVVAVGNASADKEDPIIESASVAANSSAVDDMTPGILHRRTSHASSVELDSDPSDIITLESAMVAPLEKEKTEKIAAGKSMTTKAILYRDGTLICDILTDCRDAFFGLCGIVVIVVYNEAGRAIAKSNEVRCETRGGVFDFTTPSSGRERHTLRFPEDIARRATGLDILQSEAPRAGGDPLDNIVRLQDHVRAFVEHIQAN